MKRGKCHWREVGGFGDLHWETDCGNAFSVTDGSPSENNMAFCPYCGKSLVEHPVGEDDEARQAA